MACDDDSRQLFGNPEQLNFPPAPCPHLAPLVFGHEAEGVQILLAQPPDCREGLGSRSEADRFRVEAGHRPFVERPAASEALQLGDEN